MSEVLHVAIIGGGIGGLCLAQGLKKAGIGVAVYERDRTRSDRLQGYRVHINPNGSRALHECLPPALYDHFAATCGKSDGGFRFLTEQLKELLHIEPQQPNRIDTHKSVSRITLREVLLAGLDDVVQFDKTFVHYEETPSGEIMLAFADGTSATADVLVGADGGNSRVRRQMLPDAARVDTGVLGIAGKVMLNEETRRQLDPRVIAGAALVMATQPMSLFIAKQEFQQHGPDGVNDSGSDAAGPPAPTREPGLLLDNTKDYVMWAAGAQRERYQLEGDPKELDGESLRALVLRQIGSWHPGLRQLVELADPSTISPLPIHTSVPVAPWPTRRITFVGDAIHSMTPYRGIGANVALRDAGQLTRQLATAQRGDKLLLDAIHDYEAAMRTYGFAAVRNSLQAMQQAVAVKGAKFAVMKAMFRTLNAVPPLKRLAFRNLGND